MSALDRNHLPAELAASLIEAKISEQAARPQPDGRYCNRDGHVVGSDGACTWCGASARYLARAREDSIASSPPVDYPTLSECQLEAIAVLAEECGETVQRVAKIIRFGLRVDPYTGVHNSAKLEAEVGDIMAAVELCHKYGLLDLDRVRDACERKLAAFTVDDGRLGRATVRGIR